MADEATESVESTLERAGIHQEWSDHYRTKENEKFYEMAFEHIADVFAAPKDSVVLDAGCGSCAKSKKLADQGFNVIASDLSDSALEMARQSLAGTKYESQIVLRKENVLDLSFPDREFHYVVCWGVLMHVPDVASAIAELSRIVAVGGKIAISEGNMRSLQSRLYHFLKRILKRERAEVVRAPAGIERWEETSDGQLMTRRADIKWLIDEFGKHNLALIDHRAGQLSEIYTIAPTLLLKKIIHWFNSLWFRHVRRPGPAVGNILVFQRLPD